MPGWNRTGTCHLNVKHFPLTQRKDENQKNSTELKLVKEAAKLSSPFAFDICSSSVMLFRGVFVGHSEIKYKKS